MGFINTFIEKTATAQGFEIPSLVQFGDYQDDTMKEVADLRKSKTWQIAERLLQSFDYAPQAGDFDAFAQTYSAVVWVYVSAWLLSTSIADVDLKICKSPRSKPKFIDDEKDPVVKLLMYPNEWEDGNELIENLVLFLELCGNGYWEKTYQVAKLPAKLYNLEPFFMHIKPDPVKKIASYSYDPQVGGDLRRNFRVDEIAHFKYANPLSIYYGMGAITALQTSLITELFRESYNKNFFQNEARPDIVLTHSPDVNKGIMPLQREQKRKVAQAWYSTFGGPRKVHLPVLLESGMDIKILSEARRDMDFREMEKSLRERIFAAFGIPPAMAGIFEYANYANAKEQIRIFWKVTIPPKCKRIANTINRAIIRPYNEEYFCKFDLSDITALEETVKEREERLSRMLERGGLTLGEYRQNLGIENDEKDEYKNKRVISANLVPLDDFFMPELAPGEGEEEPGAPPQTAGPGFPGEEVRGEETITHV